MKRVLFVTLFSVVFALTFALVGCGSSSSNGPIQLTGTSTTVQFGDAANDQIVKFELTVSSITLTGTGGTADTANLLANPVEFEFSHSAGALEPVSLSKVPAGSYSGATLMWSNPEVVTIDSNGVPTRVTVTPTSGTATVDFSPAIMIDTTPTFLNFDLDLANSIDLTQNPATLTPTFAASTSTVPPNGENEGENDGENDDVHGSVTMVNAPNFTIQTNSDSSIDFTTDSNTRFEDGITQVSDLKVGDIVEVDSVTQSDGTKLATKVAREGGEAGEEAEGVISDLSGTAPALTITVAHQVDSTNSANPPVTVTITTDASTQFSVRADKLNVTGTFDASHIGKGQRVEADSDGQGNSIAARKVKLREQALIGTVSNASGNTFTLTLDPSSAFASLSGATSVDVTLASGANQQVTPTDGSTVRVRGLVFFDGTSTYTMTGVRVDNNQ